MEKGSKSDSNNKRRSNNRGRGRGNPRSRQQQQQQQQSGNGQHNHRQVHLQAKNGSKARKILVLHGSRQTGQLLLGRMDKLRKTLSKECNGLQLVAPDGLFDHPDDPHLRQWWDRHDNAYSGLETSIQVLQDIWDNKNSSSEDGSGSFVGILGFSQGARLAHLIALIHQTAVSQGLSSDLVPFQGLQFVILVAGYDAPLPENWPTTLQACSLDGATGTTATTTLCIPSLHIWGASDALIPPADSQVVMSQYDNPRGHEHDGGHHVPMKAVSIRAYVDFVNEQVQHIEKQLDMAQEPGAESFTSASSKTSFSVPTPKRQEVLIPDEETMQAQQDEVEALTAIYPDEVTIISKHTLNEETGEPSFQHPISYTIALHPEDEDSPGGHWPKRSLSLGITYPHNYPSDEALPHIRLVHENNVMEFPSAKAAACMRAIEQAAEAERGMPCVLSCLYAAKEFLDTGEEVVALSQEDLVEDVGQMSIDDEDVDTETSSAVGSTILKQVSVERIQQCNLEGLAIAEELLGRGPKPDAPAVSSQGDASSSTPLLSGKGGSWLYTIGLVGKPSAGTLIFGFYDRSVFVCPNAETNQRSLSQNANREEHILQHRLWICSTTGRYR